MRSGRWVLVAGYCLAACVAQAAEHAASAPALAFKPETDTALPGASQWTMAVLVCGAALALALWWLRRRGHANALPWAQSAGRLITVLERTAVSPQVSLVAARYGSRLLLLAVGPTGAQCLRDEPLGDAGVNTEPGA